MYPNTPKINVCPCCGSFAGPVLLRDMDVEPGRTPSFESPVHWLVMCDFTKGGCGLRGGYRDTPYKAIEVWNKRKENDMGNREEKYFKALDKLGTEWRDWASKFQTIFMNAMQAADARILNMEKKLTTQAPSMATPPITKPVVEPTSKPDTTSLSVQFRRAGFTFKVVVDPSLKVTSGLVIDVPKHFEHLKDELTKLTSYTECQHGDGFSHNVGAQIVLGKLIDKVKHAVMKHNVRVIQRDQNILKDLHCKNMSLFVEQAESENKI